MPAATDLQPSDRMARVRTVAVVVPVQCDALHQMPQRSLQSFRGNDNMLVITVSRNVICS